MESSAARAAPGRAGGARAFQQGPVPGEDQRFQLEVDFLDAARGDKKRLTLPNGKSLDVNIPAGISDGQSVRLKGQGSASPNSGRAGDALIEIKVREHAFFKRDGNDIRLELPITLQEAVLGAKIDVPTIHGRVTLSIPKGANTGATLRLKGKGITVGKSGTPGDQYVSLKIMLPSGSNAELENFARTWGPKRSL